MARRPHLKADEIESLNLFDAMCDDALADTFDKVDALLHQVWSTTKDPRRRVPRKMRIHAFIRDGGKCRYCSTSVPLRATRPWMSAQADHIIPHSRGGKTVIENIWTACGPCNRRKSNKVW